MPKLNQILAIEKGVKGEAKKTIDRAYHNLQKSALMSGISRTYTPKDDEGDQLPSETTKLQLNANEILRSAIGAMKSLFDITWAKDYTNIRATADIVIGDTVILPAVPVTYLLFLEKSLVDIRTLIANLPILDPTEDWAWDENVAAYASSPSGTTRTKKIPRNHVKSPATDKHPAQVDVFYEDVIVGYWKTVKYSGAVPQSAVNEMLNRTDELIKAVKFARESANNVEADTTPVADRILNHIFPLS